MTDLTNLEAIVIASVEELTLRASAYKEQAKLKDLRIAALSEQIVDLTRKVQSSQYWMGQDRQIIRELQVKITKLEARLDTLPPPIRLGVS